MTLVAGSISVVGFKQYRRMQFEKDCERVQVYINSLRKLALIFNADTIITFQSSSNGLTVRAELDAPFKFKSLLDKPKQFTSIKNVSYQTKAGVLNEGLFRIYFLAHGSGLQEGVLSLHGEEEVYYYSLLGYSDEVRRVNKPSDLVYKNNNEPNRFPFGIYEK